MRTLLVVLFPVLLTFLPASYAVAEVLPDPPPGGGSPPPLKVIGYHVSWRQWTDSRIPWSHFTHVSYFAAYAKGNGTLCDPQSCNTKGWTRETLGALATAGHAQPTPVKVGVSLVAQEPQDLDPNCDATGHASCYSIYQDTIRDMLADGTRDTLVAGIVALLQERNADGVDVDLEWPRVADADHYVTFVQALATAVHAAPHPGYVYVAVPHVDYPPLDNRASPPLTTYQRLANASDGLLVMGYGYHHEGEGPPGPVSPISRCRPSPPSPPICDWPDYPDPLVYDALDETLDYYLSIAAPSKIFLGFPFGGIEWPTDSDHIPAARKGNGTVRLVKEEFCQIYPNAAGCETPTQDCERLLSVDKVTDPSSRTPYRIWPPEGPPGDLTYRHLYCEDIPSIDQKIVLAQSRGVAGIFFWAENYIPSNYPFWRVLDKRNKPNLPANHAPQVSIATHVPVVANRPVTLTGSATDPDLDGVILQWTQTSGPAGPPLITVGNQSSLTISPQKPGTYVFTLSATDGELTGSASTSLAVLDSHPLEAGYGSSVLAPSNGTAWAWGLNASGQIGDATTTDRNIPVRSGQSIPLTNVIAVGMGVNHTVALKSDGTVWTWGDNSQGQLGDNGQVAFRSTPAQVAGLPGIVSIAAGFNHTLALAGDGTVWTWGDNYGGQIGDGTTGADRLTPFHVPGLSGVTAIAAGGFHSVAVLEGGTVSTWGLNTSGQLGDGTHTSRSTPGPVPNLGGVRSASCGAYFTMALLTDGTLKGWGHNFYGQLGDGTTNESTVPVGVVLTQGGAPLTNVTRVAAGSAFTLAVCGDGTVWSWGRNSAGQLGDGTTNDLPNPHQIVGLTSIVEVGAGEAHSLAQSDAGLLYGWGWNAYGQVGPGPTFQTTPQPIPPPDVTPPASPTLAFSVGRTTIGVSWVATGDDGTTGTAAAYDLRRSLSPINASNFAQATIVPTGPPQPSGSDMCALVSSLTSCRTYYFGLKVLDDVGNESVLSVGQARTDCSGNHVADCF